MAWGSPHVSVGTDDDRLIDEALDHYIAMLDGQLAHAKEQRRVELSLKKARAERLLRDRRYPV